MCKFKIFHQFSIMSLCLGPRHLDTILLELSFRCWKPLSTLYHQCNLSQNRILLWHVLSHVRWSRSPPRYLATILLAWRVELSFYFFNRRKDHIKTYIDSQYAFKVLHTRKHPCVLIHIKMYTLEYIHYTH